MQQPDAQSEFLTRLTIWISLLFYVLTLVTFYFSRARRSWDAAARNFWTIACASLIIHVAFAYHFYHAWSHASAYVETAVQTKEVYGVNWGGGVFINYALMLGWMADVALWWWHGLESYRRRPKAFNIAWHAFLFFIFFNATVVFEGGTLRWLGILFTIAAVVALLHRRRMKRKVPAKHHGSGELKPLI